MRAEKSPAALWALLTIVAPSCASNGAESAGTDDSSSTGASPAPTSTSAAEATTAAPSEGESTDTPGTSESSGAPEAFGCPGDVLLDLPPDPAARGPWPVGVRTVELNDLALATEVWYPAPPGSEADTTPERYDLRQWLPPSQRDLIPDADNPLQSCDCYRDLPLDEEHGPYPVVVFVHGTAAWRAQSASLMEHLASRGFVVVASDHPGLFLGDSLAIACPDEPTGMQDLRADQDALMAALAEPSADLSFVAGHIDTSRVAVMGHSAGGSAVASFSADAGVQVTIPLAAGQRTAGPGTTLFMGGLADGVVNYSSTQDGYASSPAPKYLVGLSNAGHLAFSDICEVSNNAGQNILEVATDYSICGAQFAGLLFDCDPGFLPAEFAREIVAFSTTAVLEDVLRCSGDGEALFAELETRFPQVGEFQQQL